MIVADVMNTAVVSVTPGTTLGKAVSLMLEHGISGLPVVDAEARICGVLTEGDLLRRAEIGTTRQRSAIGGFFAGPGQLAADFVTTHSRRVSDVMSDKPITIHAKAPLAEAVEIMERRHVKRLPVVDAERRVIGVISRADLLRPLAAVLNQRPDSSVEDKALRERVMDALRRHARSGHGLVNVHVNDGNVTLEGAVYDLRIGDAARVAVENLPGVRSVQNDVVWMSANSPLAASLPLA